MPQLARLSVKPGIPKIKRRLRTGERPLETRLGFRGYTPRVGAFIERDDACCFPCFVGKVRYLRGHLRPPHKKAQRREMQDSAMTHVLGHPRVFHRMTSAKQMQASRANWVRPHHKWREPLTTGSPSNQPYHLNGFTRQTSDTGLLA